ncbi:MAG: DUF6792 domain-containing protein, partial [Bacilli bacterium]
PKKTGFVGYALSFEDNNTIIIARGSEDLTKKAHQIEDWFTNFLAGLGSDTTQHKDMNNFFLRNVKDKDGEQLLMGHSKGGNLATSTFLKNKNFPNLKLYTVNAAPIFYNSLTEKEKAILKGGKTTIISHEGDIVSFFGRNEFVDWFIRGQEVHTIMNFMDVHGLEMAQFNKEGQLNGKSKEPSSVQVEFEKSMQHYIEYLEQNPDEFRHLSLHMQDILDESPADNNLKGLYILLHLPTLATIFASEGVPEEVVVLSLKSFGMPEKGAKILAPLIVRVLVTFGVMHTINFIILNTVVSSVVAINAIGLSLLDKFTHRNRTDVINVDRKELQNLKEDIIRVRRRAIAVSANIGAAQHGFDVTCYTGAATNISISKYNSIVDFLEYSEDALESTENKLLKKAKSF